MEETVENTERGAVDVLDDKGRPYTGAIYPNAEGNFWLYFVNRQNRTVHVAYAIKDRSSGSISGTVGILLPPYSYVDFGTNVGSSGTMLIRFANDPHSPDDPAGTAYPTGLDGLTKARLVKVADSSLFKPSRTIDFAFPIVVW